MTLLAHAACAHDAMVPSFAEFFPTASFFFSITVMYSVCEGNNPKFPSSTALVTLPLESSIIEDSRLSQATDQSACSHIA